MEQFLEQKYFIPKEPIEYEHLNGSCGHPSKESEDLEVEEDEVY